MTDFATLVSEVYDLTKRPDLVSQTTQAIKAATLKLHSIGQFALDCYETGIVFDTEDYTQQLLYLSVIPRFRELLYVRKTDASGVMGQFFKLASPGSSVDRYGYNKQDIMYVAGQAINFNSSTPFQYIILGCFLHPDVTEDGYSSWIADTYKDLITIEAARAIAGSNADSERYKVLTLRLSEMLPSLNSHIMR